MIQPDDLKVGDDGARLDAGPINGGDAYIVYLARESETTWTTGRFPNGEYRFTGRITRTDDEDEPWLVEPANALHDAETWETWGEALRNAMLLTLP